MSDDVDDKDKPKDDGGHNGHRTEYDKSNARGDVSPADEKVFEFLDSLFVDDKNFPESIEVRHVKGRNSDRMGDRLKKYTFSTKPTKERLVAITNEMVSRMKVYADILGRPTVFHIAASNPQIADGFYDRVLYKTKPTGNWKGRGDEFGMTPPEEEGEDDVPFSLSYQKAFLGHSNALFGLMGGMIEGLLDRSDRQAQFMAQQLERTQAKNIELLEVNLKLVQADDDRKARMRRAEMWDKNIDRGLNMAWDLIPPMLTAGKKDHAGWQPGTDSSEAFTLRQFFEIKDGDDTSGKLTLEQLRIIFGDVDEANGTITKAGILSAEQGMLLAGVAKKEVNPDQLDALIEGGPLEITNEQVMKIFAAGVPPMVLAPLKMLFDVRKAKRREKQNGQGE